MSIHVLMLPLALICYPLHPIICFRGVFINGIKILGEALKDPYGSDPEDLTVLHYLNFTLAASRRLMLAHEQEVR